MIRKLKSGEYRLYFKRHGLARCPVGIGKRHAYHHHLLRPLKLPAPGVRSGV